MQAVKEHVLLSKFPPTIAEIVEVLTKSDAPSTTEAWAEVRSQIQSVGYVGIPKFTHPVIELTVKAFGWQNLCDSTNANVTRSNFIKLYETQVARGDQRAALSGQREIDSPEVEQLTAGIGKAIMTADKGE